MFQPGSRTRNKQPMRPFVDVFTANQSGYPCFRIPALVRTRTGSVIAFAHEVTKGKVIRGQWFYATDAASSNYVWFHSVRDLVARAIADPSVDMVDLGPSGSDAFSVLKQRYGFESVADWHTVADYRGPFRYEGGAVVGEPWDDLDPPDWLFAERDAERRAESTSSAA